MGAKTCSMHETQPAVAACGQCRKDLCKSCVMVTPTGNFCSSECSVLFREMKGQGGSSSRKSSGSATKAVLFLLLLVAAAFLVHLAPMTTGKPYDVIGKILNKTQTP
ncbi:MAG TPA: hypothetical protein VJU16_05770 [Planctomycetota bacterium]|nr:hypothetical protein [Planctomycetota bacterium]